MATSDRLRTPLSERVKGVQSSKRALNSQGLLIKRRIEAIKRAFDALEGGDQDAFKNQLERSKSFGKIINEMSDFEQIFLKAKTGQR